LGTKLRNNIVEKNRKILIIGFGSIGRKHYKIIKKFSISKNIKILSSQSQIPNKIKDFKTAIKFSPDLIIISSTTNLHLKYIKLVEKYFTNKKVLIEKPLFKNKYNLSVKKNKYYLGYHFRFDPVINFIKKKIKNQKIYSVISQNYSYLPNWRPQRNYSKTSSAMKKLGGGVLRDLSHELDFISWIFGKLQIRFAKNNKISNLKINTDDNLLVNGRTKKVADITLSTNFFSKILKRKIYIFGDKINIEANLISKSIKLFKKNKIITKKWDLNHYEINYLNQIKYIFAKRNNLSATYKDGIYIMELINQIEDFKS